ncbi:hypothetical protein GY45DRAFT_1331592 [Cubamyces sp. BRFM 1775]|nr:hypothetical protein GY45DRAFT_1331592 [Cubamyces sp. BRFM 1775]
MSSLREGGSNSRPHDDLELVDDLNELMERLGMKLPFPLESPFDLTPSLLLGILESILESRLPIPPAVRASRDFTSKVQAMKIFLGVFENDVLGGGVDVGLSDVDPRRLAAGDEEEVVFVGELLRWLGRQRGFLPPSAGPSHANDYAGVPPTLPLHARKRATSPSTHSTVTSGMHSSLSMSRPALAETDTTVMSVASEPLAPLPHAQLPELPSFRQPVPPGASSSTGGSSNGSRSRSTSTTRAQPRCIHEIEDPSFLLDGAEPDESLFDGESTSVCRCAHLSAEAEVEDEAEPDDLGDDLPTTPTTPQPVRRSGWIDHVDEESELDVFESRRRVPSSRSAPATANRRAASYSGPSSGASHPPREDERLSASTSRRIVTPHNAPTEYTLALLNERARLYDELARLKAAALVK